MLFFKKNIANLVSLSRVIAIVVALLLMHNNLANKSYIIFIVFAIFSDIFDGYIARKLGTSTAFGARMDAIADSMTILILFIGLAFLKMVGVVYLILILSRFLGLASLNFVLFLRKREIIQTSKFGKNTIVIFSILIFFYLLTYKSIFSTPLIALATGLYLISGITYFSKVFLSSKNQQRRRSRSI
jgi:CDP-diacylglycerol--glycerol-3-phosphate 3-phosphatidyltransferase